VRASATRVAQLLQSLSQLQASRESGGGPVAGAGAGGLALAIDGRAQARIGDGAGGCRGAGELAVVRADGATLCFVKEALADLRAGEVRLRERRLFPLRLDEVNAIDVTRGAHRISLRRQSGIWRITMPIESAGVARDEAVRAWLQPLLAVEARGFAAVVPQSSVRVRLASSGEEIVADVAPSAARRGGESVSLQLAAPLSVEPDLTQLRAAPDAAGVE
jgi:hypothetical protein